jgi:hypothetical protein
LCILLDVIIEALDGVVLSLLVSVSVGWHPLGSD